MTEKIEVDKSDLLKIYDAITLTHKFHVYRDHMNATLHQASETRYSPLTSTLEAERYRLRTMLGLDDDK